MGIIEKELAKFELNDGQRVIIERNVGDEIHLHVGAFRVDFTPEEFDEFATVLEKSTTKFKDIKDV